VRKVLIILFAFVGITVPVIAQQYPYWTQNRSNLFMINPAVAGTRKTLDARLTYRNQWTGFDGAPKTMGASVHGRFFKGQMGAGTYVYRDQLGPTMFTSVALAYAYHVKFKDTELSMGANGSYNFMSVDPAAMTYKNSQDPSIVNAVNTQKSRTTNVAFGVLYFNDRFHIGASMNNMLGSTYEFPRTDTKTKKGSYTTVPHYALSIGYNWSNSSALVFENSVFAHYVNGSPILLDYNLRAHINEGIFVGAGIRLKNAVIAQVGYTIDQTFQIGYSYDFSTNALRSYNTGSHEIKLVYVFDKDKNGRHGQNTGFQHRHFTWVL
jgi:type IX secretion system PorP/SprF family membrane protein